MFDYHQTVCQRTSPKWLNVHQICLKHVLEMCLDKWPRFGRSGWWTVDQSQGPLASFPRHPICPGVLRRREKVWRVLSNLPFGFGFPSLWNWKVDFELFVSVGSQGETMLMMGQSFQTAEWGKYMEDFHQQTLNWREGFCWIFNAINDSCLTFSNDNNSQLPASMYMTSIDSRPALACESRRQQLGASIDLYIQAFVSIVSNYGVYIYYIYIYWPLLSPQDTYIYKYMYYDVHSQTDSISEIGLFPK